MLFDWGKYLIHYNLKGIKRAKILKKKLHLGELFLAINFNIQLWGGRQICIISHLLFIFFCVWIDLAHVKHTCILGIQRCQFNLLIISDLKKIHGTRIWRELINHSINFRCTNHKRNGHVNQLVRWDFIALFFLYVHLIYFYICASKIDWFSSYPRPVEFFFHLLLKVGLSLYHRHVYGSCRQNIHKQKVFNLICNLCLYFSNTAIDFNVIYIIFTVNLFDGFWVQSRCGL